MTPHPQTLYSGKHLQLLCVGNWEYASRNKASGAVAILAVTALDEVLLIEQFRPPVGKRVIELPAGLVGDTEADAGATDPLLAGAKRELLEETGYVAAQWEQVCHGPSSAGLSSEEITFFLASELTSQGPALGDGDEELVQHCVPRADLLPWLATKQAHADK